MLSTPIRHTPGRPEILPIAFADRGTTDNRGRKVAIIRHHCSPKRIPMSGGVFTDERGRKLPLSQGGSTDNRGSFYR